MAEPRPLAVDLQGLERRFGAFVAVANLSLQVRQGEVFGFLGPNGAGKSTTIRMLCGILPPTGGNGTVAGYDIRREAEAIKTQIGYMSQRFSLYGDLTVEENIDFYSGIYRLPTARKRERKEWVVAMAGLEAHRRTRAADLSGGWKQRLALGCAILHEPPIVFLDEPTAGVDPISRRNFWELIYRLATDGVTVFVTTHYLDEAEYCDRLGLIYRGELVALGTPAELKSRAMGETVLELDCSAPQSALDLLEGLPGIRHAALFGKGLHLVVEGDAEVLPEIAASLAAAGIDGIRLQPIVPSLEDVFVSLIEAKDRQAGADRRVTP